MFGTLAAMALSFSLAAVPDIDYCESCGEPSAIVGVANFDDRTSGEVCKSCQAFFNLSIDERAVLRYYYLVG